MTSPLRIRYCLIGILLPLYVSLFSMSAAHDASLTVIPDQPPRNQRSLSGNSASSRTDGVSTLRFSQTAFAFLPSLQVNVDTGNHVNDFAPVVAVSKAGHIYIVWNGDETTKSILFSRSTDGGRTFSPAVKINDNVVYPPSYSAYQPDIALADDGTIYVVWHDYRQWTNDQSWTSPIDIFMDKSTDGGRTWHADIRVSSGSGTYPWHFQPSIAVDGGNGNIFVSFTDHDRHTPEGDAGDVSVAASVDRGASFSNKVRVDDTPDSLHAVQTFSSIAVDSKNHNVYVAFSDSRHGSTDIILAKSVDSAQSFMANVRANHDTTRDQEEPCVRVSPSGSVYVVWKDWSADPTPSHAPYDNDMLIARSTDAGSSFAPGVRINDVHLNAEYSYNFPPRLAIDDSGHVHVTWFDFRLNYTNCYYDASVDGGRTFSQDLLVNDNRDSLSHALPRIAVGNGRVHVVYMDKRNGNNTYDIFFTAKGPLASAEDTRPLPKGLRLDQNYPNPFNPCTRIPFSVSSAGARPGMSAVTLRVYDILGKETATLVDEVLPAGHYEVEFDASSSRQHLSSGVYYYQLRAGGSVETKKMVYMK